jgi:hypothetical protein
MEKTQSLLAALLGWFIGSFTMWRLGFDTLTALFGGLLIGAPLAYIAYDARIFWTEVRFQFRKKAIALTLGEPLLQLPSFQEIGARVRGQMLLALNTLKVVVPSAFFAILWTWQSFHFIRGMRRGAVDGIGEPDFFEILAVTWFLSAILSFAFSAILFWAEDARFKKANTRLKKGFTAGILTLGTLNLFLWLAGVGVVIGYLLVYLVLIVLRDATIKICCSGRLIALASASIGLICEWQTGSVLAGFLVLVASWGIQWFLLHDWAMTKRRLSLGASNGATNY